MSQPSLLPDRRASREELLDRGYLRIPRLVDESTVAQLEREIDALSAPGSGVRTVRDASGSVLVMNRLDRVSDLLFDLARDGDLIALASELLGKPALSLQVEYFAKPPHGGTAAPPHQDHAFYHAHFPDELALSIWIALDDVDPDGGALEYGVGSPLALLPHVPSPALDFDLELACCPELAFEVAVVPRGGALVHHSYAVHRTATNRTSRPRRAVVFNYRGSPYRERHGAP
jgi:ectoine hydroxylase-related dioxygenase (phytanoyl-CoA dioxygenase family)